MRRQFFQWLAGAIERHRLLCALGVAATVAASLAWLATGALGVNSSRNGVVDDDDPEQMLLMAYNHRFGTGYDIVAVLRGQDPAQLRAVSNEVADGLRENPDIDQVFYRVDLEAMAENGLYYLPTSHLEGLLTNLQRVKDSMDGNAGGSDEHRQPVVIAGVGDAIATLNERIDDFVEGETGGLGGYRPSTADLQEAAEFFAGLIDELTGWLGNPNRTRLGLKARFARRETGLTLDEDGYVVADGGKLLLMRIRSQKDVADDRFAGPLTKFVADVLIERVPDGVSWGITGVPVMVAEEQGGLRRDLPLTSAVSAVACLLIFLLAYRSLSGTLVVFLPLAAGLAWTMAAAAALVGSLNLVTSAFAVILIGMGIDFSVHLFTRIRDERKQGVDGPEATRRGLMGTGPAVLTGAVTSSAAFGAMAFADFRAVRELGVIASTGLLLILLATFLLLPLVLGREGTQIGAARTDRFSVPLVWRWPSRLNAPLLVLGLLITVGFASTIRVIEFNFDWTEYLPADSPAVETMQTLEEAGVAGIHFAITQASTLEQSRAQYDKLVAMTRDPDGVVERVESIFDVLPPDLASKEPIVANIRKLASSVPRVTFEAAPDASVAKLGEEVEGLLERLTDDLPFVLRQLGQGDLVFALEPVRAAMERLRDQVTRLETDDLRHRLNRFEARFASISQRVNRFFRKDHAPLRPEDLPRSLVSAFYQPATSSQAATYVVRVYPSHATVADPALGRRLKHLLRELDPEATGYAITEVHFGELMRDGLWQAAMWSAIFVLFLVLVDLRRLRDVALALVPLLMGGIWMLGLMNVLDVRYGFANTVAIPLIIGIGIDSGLHLIHRWRECDEDVGLAILTTGKAILVSSLTTMCAFGSLLLASHGGARDLGFTLLLGVGACMIASLVFLPALLDVVSRRAEPD